MKLKYLFLALVASAFVFSGCEDEVATSLDNIQLSKTYLSIPEGGGSAELTITATEAWTFDQSAVPSWLSIDQMAGGAGVTKLNFSAQSVSGGREADLKIAAGIRTQFLKVRQGSMEAASATCAQVIAGPDGKTYRVSGTVTSIVNTEYGNWYLKDATGEIYIYGTLDANGATKKFASWGLEVGDVVTIEGPKTTYGATVELVDVTILNITKSLVKVISQAQTLPKENGTFDVKVAYKGDGLFPSVPEAYRSWVSIYEVKNKPGVVSKTQPNPADTAIVTLALKANDGGDRTGSVSFTSSTSTVTYNFTQKGAIINVTIAEFIAAPDGLTQYRLSGIISKDTGNKYGNIYIKDATGEVYIYGVLDADGKAGQWNNMGIKEGDIVTLVTPHASYKGTAQGKNDVIENHISVTPVSVADFLAAETGTAYYRLEGTVGSFSATDMYGNFNISQDGVEVYVYGLLSGWGGAKKNFQNLVAATGLKAGDLITIVGQRTAYKGTPQVGNAFYVKHQAN